MVVAEINIEAWNHFSVSGFRLLISPNNRKGQEKLSVNLDQADVVSPEYSEPTTLFLKFSIFFFPKTINTYHSHPICALEFTIPHFASILKSAANSNHALRIQTAPTTSLFLLRPHTL
ncbi:hypothetical protein CICLE_v10024362mg [Citrus x clementina]|uniref:Uncharacterized protein n=1 Tax=Citrus clementina TaxID=85681 RepID=V4TH88_CITCL|nr:hypothetical protein CICLE_v10024362mg [Citrus x clementina]